MLLQAVGGLHADGHIDPAPGGPVAAAWITFIGVTEWRELRGSVPWYGTLASGELYKDAGTFLSVHEYTHVQRWASSIAARPAVQRGRRVNRINGDPSTHVPERHDASDLDT